MKPWVRTVLIRSRAIAGQRKQQGRLKPAAMLVAAFQIHVGLPTVLSRFLRMLQFRAAHQDGARRGTGINPDIERVVGFGGGFRAFPIGRFHQRPKFSRGFFEPDIRAVSSRSDRRRCERFVHRGWHCLAHRKMRGSAHPRCAGARCTSPDAISRRLRCGSCPNRESNCTRVDLFKRVSRKLFVIDFDEPLIHRAEDRWGFCCASNADSCDDNFPDATAPCARAIRAAPLRWRRSCRAFPEWICRSFRRAFAARAADRSCRRGSRRHPPVNRSASRVGGRR